jgi:hypothetical protein
MDDWRLFNWTSHFDWIAKGKYTSWILLRKTIQSKSRVNVIYSFGWMESEIASAVGVFAVDYTLFQWQRVEWQKVVEQQETKIGHGSCLCTIKSEGKHNLLKGSSWRRETCLYSLWQAGHDFTSIPSWQCKFVFFEGGCRDHLTRWWLLALQF